MLLIFGFIMPGVDNWAHLGGLGGGYLTAKLLDPLKPERGDHLLWPLGCLVVSLPGGPGLGGRGPPDPAVARADRSGRQYRGPGRFFVFWPFSGRGVSTGRPPG